MGKVVQARVPVDLAERVARAAENEGRSVSQWLRLLIKERLGEVRPAAKVTAKTAADPSRVAEAVRVGLGGCAHEVTEQRKTSFGVRRFCTAPGCGEMVQ